MSHDRDEKSVYEAVASEMKAKRAIHKPLDWELPRRRAESLTGHIRICRSTCIISVAIEVDRLGHNHRGTGRGRNKLDGRMTDLNNARDQATVKARHVDVRNRTKRGVRHRRLEMHTRRKRRGILIVGRHVDLSCRLLVKANVRDTCVLRLKEGSGWRERRGERVSSLRREMSVLWCRGEWAARCIRLVEARQVDALSGRGRSVPLQVTRSARCRANLRKRLRAGFDVRVESALLLGLCVVVAGLRKVHLTSRVWGFEATRRLGRFEVGDACLERLCHC